MKYVPPRGKEADAPYVDANPATATPGSVVPGAALEHVMREIVEVIVHAGLAPNGADLTQLRQAIDAKIASALGGGSPGDYVTASQLTGLRIYPEILSADGRMNVTSPAAGTILVPPGVSFRFNSFFTFSTSDNSEAQRLFTTLPNKVYHQRRRRSAATFELLDLADPVYNPTGAPETDPRFDSTYDDMLTTRIVTNSANVAAITNLANLPSLRQTVQKTSVEYPRTSASVPFTAFSVNWARSPRVLVSAFAAPPDMSIAQWEFPFGVEVGGPAGPGAPTRYDGGARVLGFVPAEGSFGLGTFRLELDA